MKNKVVSLLMTALLISAAIPFQSQAATSFSDVNSHWAKNEITYLSERHIIGGYPDGTFKPNQPITRSQASAMLIKALKIPLTTNTTIEFKDVSKNSPYYQILATVNEKGILRGDNGFIRPGEQTSRAQMAAILRRSFDMPLDKQATFIDVSPAHWAYQDINGIAKQRVAGGSEGTFMPTNSVTRAQFSAFLVRALDDSMKLSRYHSYISTKGEAVEQGDFIYSLMKEEPNYRLMKDNKKTGERKTLVKSEEIPKSAWDSDSAQFMGKHFRLIAYNEEIYMPYWSGGMDATHEHPYEFALMKVKMNGQDLMKMNSPNSETFRNLFIWNDRMFFTNSTDIHSRSAYPNYGYVDKKLTLYSTDLDGKSNKRKEHVFDITQTFYPLPGYSPTVEGGAENRSIVYDHSAMYYFNKTGAYKYNLLDQQTTKMSSILVNTMRVTDTELVLTDILQNEHRMKR